jgi:hypothetical protein
MGHVGAKERRVPRPELVGRAAHPVGLVRPLSICESAARLTPLLAASSSSDKLCAAGERFRLDATRTASSFPPGASGLTGPTRGRKVAERAMLVQRR